MGNITPVTVNHPKTNVILQAIAVIFIQTFIESNYKIIYNILHEPKRFDNEILNAQTMISCPIPFIF